MTAFHKISGIKKLFHAAWVDGIKETKQAKSSVVPLFLTLLREQTPTQPASRQMSRNRILCNGRNPYAPTDTGVRSAHLLGEELSRDTAYALHRPAFL